MRFCYEVQFQNCFMPLRSFTSIMLLILVTHALRFRCDLPTSLSCTTGARNRNPLGTKRLSPSPILPAVNARTTRHSHVPKEPSHVLAEAALQTGPAVTAQTGIIVFLLRN